MELGALEEITPFRKLLVAFKKRFDFEMKFFKNCGVEIPIYWRSLNIRIQCDGDTCTEFVTKIYRFGE